MTIDIEIKNTVENDLTSVLKIHKLAFPDEPSVAVLTDDLLKDDTAEPRISLLAYDADKPVGHILFTKASIENGDDNTLMHILAPLAVLPEYQNKGIGGMLIAEGLKRLKEIGSKVVFVLGHIHFYPKHGFINDAGNLGYPAPYPIPEDVKDAWMVMALTSEGLINKGKVICAKAMDSPEHWSE